MKTLLLIALVSLAVAVPANAAPPTLTGTVGPGFTITLKKSGTKVTSLKAGKYKFVVTDKSRIHDFRLTGPKGFSKVLTGLAYTGTKTYTITLTPGTWRYVCHPHSTTMKGSFTVKRCELTPETFTAARVHHSPTTGELITLTEMQMFFRGGSSAPDQ